MLDNYETRPLDVVAANAVICTIVLSTRDSIVCCENYLFGIAYCGRMELFEEGDRCVRAMFEHGLPPDSYTYTVLLAYLAKKSPTERSKLSAVLENTKVTSSFIDELTNSVGDLGPPISVSSASKANKILQPQSKRSLKALVYGIMADLAKSEHAAHPTTYNACASSDIIWSHSGGTFIVLSIVQSRVSVREIGASE